MNNVLELQKLSFDN
ncbi:class III lanthipeptide, partial [Mammaliicoccus sp. FSL K6-3158]